MRYSGWPAFLVFLLAVCFNPLGMHGQIVVDTSSSPAELVKDVLLGPGIKVRDIRYKGSKLAIGHFQNKSADPDIQEGIVLSTGSVFDVIGPNSIPSNGRINSYRGDHELDEIARGITQDAAVLEFDFMAQKDSLHFFFFFASEEYNEYVGSEFNDVFAFIISGPGYEEPTNIAVIRGYRLAPISINTVNASTNRSYYIDNNVWNSRGYVIKDRDKSLNQTLLKNFQFDGMTTVLRAKARVIPGKAYHIKIGIADVSDGRYDSAVFLEAGSFTSKPYDPKLDRHLTFQNDPANRDTSFVNMDWENDSLSIKTDETPIIVARDSSRASFRVETKPTETLTKEEENDASIAFHIAVEFDFDSDELTASARQNLEKAITMARKIKGVRVELKGHTDIVGDHRYNQSLSERRAASVSEFFESAGMSTKRIKKAGFSFDQPAATNTTPEGRARNRRVEVILRRP